MVVALPSGLGNAHATGKPITFVQKFSDFCKSLTLMATCFSLGPVFPLPWAAALDRVTMVPTTIPATKIAVEPA